MMRAPSRALWLCLTLVLGGSVNAWEKEYQTAFRMGDTDSRASARAAALDQLRMQAAGEAGVYVEGRTTLRGDQLEEQITQIRGALVQLESLEERFEPQADGYTRLTLRARARVDDSLLAQRVAALRQDAEKTRRMAQLAQENAVLRAGLSALARERLQAIDAERQALLDEQEALLRRQLGDNLQATRDVLLSLTPQLADVESRALAADQARLQRMQQWRETVFVPLQQTELRAEVSLLQRSADTPAYALEVGLSWSLSLAADSPLDRLCREAECVLGYTRRLSAAADPPGALAERLHAPFARRLGDADRPAGRWQPLTLQVYLPRMAAAERQAWQDFLAGEAREALATAGGRTLRAPFLLANPLDPARNGDLVILLQGATLAADTDRYDPVWGSGSIACAQEHTGRACDGVALAALRAQVLHVAAETLRRDPQLKLAWTPAPSR